jgi:SAM-dependent methyltransferase
MSVRHYPAVLATLLLTAALVPAVRAADYTPQVGQPGKDVVWVPTPDEVVEQMLEMAQVKPNERLVDLGSGDGKIAIAAAKRGARARGVEFNPDMVTLSRRNAAAAGVKVDFIRGDIFKVNFRDADVVTLYLLPALNERLRPILLDMKPGTRVTSHQFGMGDWEPDQTVNVASRSAHLWIVPARVQGPWQLRVGDTAPLDLRLNQRYQRLDGRAHWDGRTLALTDTALRGRDVRFTLADGQGAGWRFEGRVEAPGRIAGNAVALADGSTRPFVATRQAVSTAAR